MDDALHVFQAVDAHKLIAYLLSSWKMAEVPAQMLAHLDVVIFAFEFCVNVGVFERHEQPFFSCRYHVGQVFGRGNDALREQRLELFAVAENPGIAQGCAANQHAVHSSGGSEEHTSE